MIEIIAASGATGGLVTLLSYLFYRMEKKDIQKRLESSGFEEAERQNLSRFVANNARVKLNEEEQEGLENFNVLFFCHYADCEKYSRYWQTIVEYKKVKLEGGNFPEEKEINYKDQVEYEIGLIEHKSEYRKMNNAFGKSRSIHKSMPLEVYENLHKRVCPHCRRIKKLKVSNDDYEWLETETDCLKIHNAQGYHEVESMLLRLDKAIKQDRDIKAFAAYKKLDKPLNWLPENESRPDFLNEYWENLLKVDDRPTTEVLATNLNEAFQYGEKMNQEERFKNIIKNYNLPCETVEVMTSDGEHFYRMEGSEWRKAEERLKIK